MQLAIYKKFQPSVLIHLATESYVD
ncbi:uncharacterized protein METZ01_LOCUS129603 [marine metagenome]|uniref:NAD(P)-binding domain-containing protein n=1 Tax=marine metagenome TaxID=408172 RepID=A0A381YI82_9ZZZZ